MTRAPRPSDFPLITRLAGGRVNHMATQLPDAAQVQTACGHTGLPQATHDQHATCQGCLTAFTAQENP